MEGTHPCPWKSPYTHSMDRQGVQAGGSWRTSSTYTMASVSWASCGDVQPKISPGDSGLHWGTHTLYWERSSCAAAYGRRGVSKGQTMASSVAEAGDPWHCWGHPSPGSRSCYASAQWQWRRTRLLRAAPGWVMVLPSQNAQQGSANISIKRQEKMLNASIAPCLDRHGSGGSFISSPSCPAGYSGADRQTLRSFPCRCRHCIKMPSAPLPALTFTEQLPGEAGRVPP